MLEAVVQSQKIKARVGRGREIGHDVLPHPADLWECVFPVIKRHRAVLDRVDGKTGASERGGGFAEAGPELRGAPRFRVARHAADSVLYERTLGVERRGNSFFRVVFAVALTPSLPFISIETPKTA